MQELFDILDELFEGDEEPKEYRHPEHGKVVKVEMNNYQDVRVYEDGHREVAYTYTD